MKINLLFKWFKSKKWFEKFFLILILLRPIAEPFFYLKKSSPMLSPLYWIGVLTFLICLLGISVNNKIKSKNDNYFNFWTILVVVNILCLLASTDFLNFFIFGLKLIYPVIIFYFFRGFIKSKYDLYGILMFLFISSGIASLWFLFDIQTVGLNLRVQSSFADVINYGVYANLALICVLYFALKFQILKKVLWKPKTLLILGVFLISLLTFYAIKHLASIAVFISILATFAYFLSRKKIGPFIVVIGIFLITFLIIADRFMEDVVNERIVREVQVVNGNRDQSQALHGRVSRWEWLFEDFSKAPYFNQVFGYPTSLQYSNHMIGVTPHNDFLRVLFFTGFFGLFFYLGFLFRMIQSIKKLAISEKFLLLSALFCFFLYSISTVPTFYPGFNNFIFAIFAFVSLPIQKINELD